MPTLTSNEIRELLISFLSESFPLFDFTFPDTTPITEHGIDSLGTTEIMLYIEEKFHVNIEDSDLTRANFGTIQGLVSYISRKQK